MRHAELKSMPRLAGRGILDGKGIGAHLSCLNRTTILYAMQVHSFGVNRSSFPSATARQPIRAVCF